MASINKSGVPTRKTKGAIGDIYIDSNTGDKYKCTFAYRDFGKDFDYEWKKIESGENPKAKEAKEVKEVKPVEPDIPKKEVTPNAANSQNQGKQQYKNYYNQYKQNKQ